MLSVGLASTNTLRCKVQEMGALCDFGTDLTQGGYLVCVFMHYAPTEQSPSIDWTRQPVTISNKIRCNVQRKIRVSGWSTAIHMQLSLRQEQQKIHPIKLIQATLRRSVGSPQERQQKNIRTVQEQLKRQVYARVYAKKSSEAATSAQDQCPCEVASGGSKHWA